ncbi:MAG TPA: Ig-like domain-containing protein [Caulobacteraceae bacterium]|nr:Ig-like domain-containing protein [Caulobacteraceae bacterium]
MSTINVSSTAQLTSALYNAQAGDTILLAAGTYSGFGLNGLNCPGVTITSADPNNKAVLNNFELDNSGGITFRDLEFVTNDPTGYFAFIFEGCHDITVDHVSIHGSMDGNPQNDQEGIGIGHSTNIVIENSEFQELRRGIAGSNSSNVIISDNYMHNLQTTGMMFGSMNGIQIVRNYITELHIVAGDHPDAIQFITSGNTVGSSNVLISDNLITRGAGDAAQGIFLRDELMTLPYQNLTITDNFLLGTGYNGIAVVDGLINGNISNNQLVSLDNDLNKTWVLIQGGDQVTMSNNTAFVVSAVGVTNLTAFGNNQVPATTDAGSAELAAWLSLHPEMAWTQTGTLPTGGSTGGTTGGSTSGTTSGSTGDTTTTTTTPPTNLNLDPTTDSGTVGDGITKNTVVRIDGKVAEGGATVTLLSDNIVVGTAVADSAGSFSVQTSDGLGNGAHKLHAVAQVNGGPVSSASAELGLTVDTVAAHSDLIDFSLVRGSRTETVHLSGSASDDSAGAVSIALYRDGNLVKTVADGSAGWAFADTTNASVHTYTVKSTDVAGNVANADHALVIGTASNQKLHGTTDADFIWGAGGYDALTGGGGADTFVFQSTADAPMATYGRSGKLQNVESITDFTAGDKIDLTGVGHLTFDGQSTSAHANAVDWYLSGGNTYVIADVNGDGRADMMIQLVGNHSLSASDFLLG